MNADELDREVEELIKITEYEIKEGETHSDINNIKLLNLLQSQQQSLKLLQKVSSKDKELLNVYKELEIELRNDLDFKEQRIKELELENKKLSELKYIIKDIKSKVSPLQDDSLHKADLQMVIDKLNWINCIDSDEYIKEKEIDELIILVNRMLLNLESSVPEQKPEIHLGFDLDKKEINKKIDNELLKDLQEAEQLLFEVMVQTCIMGDGVSIDNRCMTDYEDACSYLFKRGYLEKVNDRVYKVKEKRA